VFVNQTREAHQVSPAAVLLTSMFGIPLLGFMAAAGGAAGPLLVVGGLSLAVTLLPLATIVRRARRLLSTGYGLEDAQLALKEDVERRREELLFEFGPPGWVDRVLKYTTIGAFTVTGGSLGLMLMRGFPDASDLLTVFGVATTTFVVSGLTYAARSERRRDIWGGRWLRFWNSRFGRWAFRLAGVGLKNVPAAATVTYRPTELALGLAADHLYQALPKRTQRELPDLPQVVRRLEADAHTMRRRIEELNDLIAQVGDDVRAGGERRARLREDLQSTRDAAQAKMLDAVTALETIRLGLLRLQAGGVTTGGITEDLAAARGLLGDLAVLQESAAEVERELKAGG
jgi:hypothetical protein